MSHDKSQKTQNDEAPSETLPEPVSETANDLLGAATAPENGPPRKKLSAKARVLLLLKLAISLGLIGWLLSKVQFQEIFATVRQADLRWILVACLPPIIGAYLTASRWRGLLLAQGVRVTKRCLIQSCIVAAFFRQFLPSTIGGDAVRAYDSWKAGANKSVALAALAVDRLVGLLVLVLFAVMAILIPSEITSRFPSINGWVAAAACLLVVAIWCVFAPASRLFKLAVHLLERFPKVVARPMLKMSSAVATYQGKPRSLSVAMLWSLLLQINVIAYDFIIARSLGFEIPYQAFFLITPIVVFVTLVPISINGIGVRESCYVALFQIYGIAESGALAFSLIHYSILLIYAALGGLVYLLRKSPRPAPQWNQAEPVRQS